MSLWVVCTWREGGNGLRTFFTFSFSIRGLGSEWDEGLRVKEERGEGGRGGGNQSRLSFPWHEKEKKGANESGSGGGGVPPSLLRAITPHLIDRRRKEEEATPFPPLSPRGRDFPRTRASSNTDRPSDRRTDGRAGEGAFFPTLGRGRPSPPPCLTSID